MRNSPPLWLQAITNTTPPTANTVWYPQSKYYKVKSNRLKRLKKCADCDGVVATTKTRCPDCTYINTKNKEYNKTIKRRIQLQIAGYEPINRIKVFIRDKWKCQLCGTDTPKELSGKQADNAPTIDHIIPISKGGTHTYINVQLLCRRCNCTVKRDLLINSQ